MTSPFSFKGRIGRLPYALWSLGIFLSQYVFVIAAFKAYGLSLEWHWDSALMPMRAFGVPMRAFGGYQDIPVWLIIKAFAVQVLIYWLFAALAFRRTADAGLSGWFAAFAIVPITQLLLILLLSFVPRRDREDLPAMPAGNGAIDSRFAVQGIVAGIVLTLAGVGLGALVFGSYGYAVFLVTPFIIGVTTGAIANWRQDMGHGTTTKLVFTALALGGVALVMTAIEGIVCIAMAAPFAIGMAYPGGLLGREMARQSHRSMRRTLSGFTVLPLVLVGETLLPPMASFETEKVIEIHASPAVVWQSLVTMDTIDEPLPLVFRLGMAYPLRGEIIGEGIGAIRLGTFSTGVAVERVTEWEPGRKLAFTVVKDVPAMKELSPYAHVHAPHVLGYFTTSNTSFELRPRADGGTLMIERTSHALKLDPVLYWLPLARWVIDVNNARVLAHIKHRSEAKAMVAASMVQSGD